MWEKLLKGAPRNQSSSGNAKIKLQAALQSPIQGVYVVMVSTN
jgi:hypothetical protein